jgi:putative transposase
MENYRKSSPSRYAIKYHFVWITKYRKQVLTGPVAIRLRDLIRAICLSHEVEIL